MLNSKQRAYLGSFIGSLVNKETGITSKDKRLVYLVEMRHCRLFIKNGWSGNLKSHFGKRGRQE
jgi:formylmethanofuran dehydrogenase subunit E